MSDFNRAALLASLRLGEGFRARLYDDDNGQPIGPGSTLVGHPTVGTGHALDVDDMPADVDDLWTNHKVDAADQGLAAALPYYLAVPEVRRRVMIEMAYEMGVRGMLGFTNMLGAVRLSQWDAAADHMLDSDWARQVGDRAQRLSIQMRTGV